jgi:hypothetical protein
MSAPEARRPDRRIDEWFTSATTIAGGVAALAGFVYFVGGMVMWLRFRTAGLPADQGVALMSREQLFVVGLRLMILPTLVTGTIAALLAYRAADAEGGARGTFGRAALAALACVAVLLPVWSFAVAGWPAQLAGLLVALVIVGGAGVAATIHARAADAPLARVPRWLPPAIACAAAALVLVLCLAVPGLEVHDELWARAAVAGAAIAAMFVPVVIIVARRLPRPPAAVWWVVAMLAVAVAVLAASSWWTHVAIMLGAAIAAGVLAALAAILRGGGPSTGLRRWTPALLAIAAVGLVVPWSFASATWPLGLAIVIGIWLLRGRRATGPDADGPAERRRRTVSMAVAAVVAAAVVSVGRQLDEPVQLLRAEVTYQETRETLEGAYVNATGDTVYVGDEAEGTIEAIPRDQIRRLSVGPPQERAPSPSLLSRILPGDERFSARPLEFWCDGERYNWLEAAKVCETQPEVAWTTPLHERFLDRLGMPVRVSCPAEARDVCRGWVLLRSRTDLVQGRFGVPRPLDIDPVRFAVGPRKITEVCLTLSAGQLELLRKAFGENAVPFETVLAEDAEGENVLRREYYGLLVGPGRIGDIEVDYSDCVPRLRLAHGIRGDDVTVTVRARPDARGITPWLVEGSIRLTATPGEARDGAGSERKSVEVGVEPLADGRAQFTPKLPPGDWVVIARYISVAGLPYDKPKSELAITVPRQRSRARRDA